MIIQLVKHTAATRDALRIDLSRELLVDGYRIMSDRPHASETEFRPAWVLEWNIQRSEVHFAEAIAMRSKHDWSVHSIYGFSIRAKYDGTGSPAISKHDLVTIGPRGYYLLREMLEAAKGKQGGMRVNPGGSRKTDRALRTNSRKSVVDRLWTKPVSIAGWWLGDAFWSGGPRPYKRPYRLVTSNHLVTSVGSGVISDHWTAMEARAAARRFMKTHMSLKASTPYRARSETIRIIHRHPDETRSVVAEWTMVGGRWEDRSSTLQGGR